jgi:hypothetical protein
MEQFASWIIDCITALIAWLIPGKTGKALAVFIAWLLFIALMLTYVMNRETFEKFFGKYCIWRVAWVRRKL